MYISMIQDNNKGRLLCKICENKVPQKLEIIRYVCVHAYFLLCQSFSVCGSAAHNTVRVSIPQCVWQCST